MQMQLSYMARYATIVCVSLCYFSNVNDTETVTIRLRKRILNWCQFAQRKSYKNDNDAIRNLQKWEHFYWKRNWNECDYQQLLSMD